MKIAVCIKQVIDTQLLTRISGDTGIDDYGVPRVVNMCDLVAMEEALQLRERAKADEIVAISMGPPPAKEALHRCLAMGADNALLLCDPGFEAADSYATALVLAKALEGLDAGLILCGQKAADTQAGLVPYHLGEMLGIPVIAGAIKLELDSDKKLKVERKLEGGFRDVLEAPLPAVVAVDSALNEPRYVSLRAISRAKKIEIMEYDAEGLGLDLEDVGQNGSKTAIVSVSRPRPKKIFVPDMNLSAIERLVQVESGGLEEKEARTLSGSPDEIASELVQILLNQKLLKI